MAPTAPSSLAWASSRRPGPEEERRIESSPGLASVVTETPGGKAP